MSSPRWFLNILFILNPFDKYGFIVRFSTDDFFAPFAMLVVTHEMDFARAVADRMYFFDEGLIVEGGALEDNFHNPQEERTKLFLSQI